MFVHCKCKWISPRYFRDMTDIPLCRSWGVPPSRWAFDFLFVWWGSLTEMRISSGLLEMKMTRLIWCKFCQEFRLIFAPVSSVYIDFRFFTKMILRCTSFWSFQMKHVSQLDWFGDFAWERARIWNELYIAKSWIVFFWEQNWNP